LDAPASSQAIRFCTTRDGVRIAYAVSGSGPPLVKTANWLSHVELDWDSPVWRPWLTFLSRHRTLIRYDARGCGLSERDVERVSLDDWLEDLGAVVQHAGLERFELFGMSQGGPIAVRFAASEPERVERLVLHGVYARGLHHRGLPRAEKEAAAALPSLIRGGWGSENPAFRQLFTSLFLPGASPEQARWFNELERVSATPEVAARVVEACDLIDVTEDAQRVRAPTLVLHARGDARVPVAEGRLMAALVPDARFVELASDNHVLLETEPAWTNFVRDVSAFLGVTPPAGTAAPGPSTALSELTRRERDVLRLLADGLTNKQIARRLDLSPKTVRNYVSLVLAKLGAATRTEAVAIALRAWPRAD
jgi:pimeloyl-ACP methyl ester carboxylesterase/DNA-binding CsgD family transcriptional regulator